MSKISEFMLINKQQKAQVIFEMVDTIARETELPLDIVCKIVANYKNWSVHKVKQYLNIYDEKYLINVAMYQDGKTVSKGRMSESCYNILKDKLLKTIEESPFMVPASMLKRILNDYATEINW